MATLAWAAVAAFALCGLRASGFARQGLPAAMEGQDVRITAVVAAMPQRTEAGVRLRLQVESADWADAAPDAGRARAPERPGTAPQVPPLIDVSWYGGVLRDPQGLVDLQRHLIFLQGGLQVAFFFGLKRLLEEQIARFACPSRILRVGHVFLQFRLFCLSAGSKKTGPKRPVRRSTLQRVANGDFSLTHHHEAIP